MDRKPLDNLTVVSKYDPTKNYEWEKTDIFSVSGNEIDLWMKAINASIAGPEFQKFMVIQRAAIAMNEFIKDAAEQGLIRPQEPLKKAEEDESTEQVV